MSEFTEIDQALEVARKTRDAILFGKTEFEKHVYGFFTVAQILNRDDDLKWIQKEIRGYKKDDELPSYRKKVFRRCMANKIQLTEIMDDDISRFEFRSGMSFIEIELATKENERLPLRATADELEIIKKYHPNISRAGWDIPKSSLDRTMSGIKLELLKRLNIMIAEITYGKIPQGIFKKFQEKVNKKLTESNPNAVSELNIAYESLGKSEDPERVSHVAFACRRLIKSIADELYPSQETKKLVLKSGKEVEVGKEQFLNRLEAYVDTLNSPNRKFLTKKLALLRDLYGEIPESINKGTHLTINNKDAENLVIYTYLILGDIVTENELISNKS